MLILSVLRWYKEIEVCIGPGSDWIEDRNGGKCWTKDQTGPGPNSTACKMRQRFGMAVPPWFSGHGQPVSNGTIVPHPSGKKLKKKLRKIGPPVRSVGAPVQPGTEPKTEFQSLTDRRLDRRGPIPGPIRTGSDRTENCTPLQRNYLEPPSWV